MNSFLLVCFSLFASWTTITAFVVQPITIRTTVSLSDTEESEWYSPPKKEAKLAQHVKVDIPEITSHADWLEQLQANEHRILVVKVYASWCKSCQKFGGLYHKLGKAQGDKMDSNSGTLVTEGNLGMAAMEYGRNSQLCKILGIKRLPTVIFYHKCRPLTQFACKPADFHMVQEAVQHYTNLSTDELDFEADMEEKKQSLQDLQQETTKTNDKPSIATPSSTQTSVLPKRKRWWKL